MAYKIGFILSLIFVVQLFVLMGDIMAIQMIYTNLDAVSVTAGYLISQNGKITTEVVELVKSEAGANIESLNDDPPMLGGLFTFKISKQYDPLIMQEGMMDISIQRSVVIGYYNPIRKELNHVRNQRTITWYNFDDFNFLSCFSNYDSGI